MTQRHAPTAVKEAAKEEELEEVVKEAVQTAQKTVEVPQFVHVDRRTRVEVHNQGRVQTVTPRVVRKLRGAELTNMEWGHQITGGFGLWYARGSAEDIKQFCEHKLWCLWCYDACDEDQ